jgi:hypothetical protein
MVSIIIVANRRDTRYAPDGEGSFLVVIPIADTLGAPALLPNLAQRLQTEPTGYPDKKQPEVGGESVLAS